MSSETHIENGTAYVAAKVIAKRVDLVSDYVSRMCRQGDVDGRLVDGTWYVNEASLFDFLSRKHSKKRAYAARLSKELKAVGRTPHEVSRAPADDARSQQLPESEPEQPPLENPEPLATPLTPEQQLLKDKTARAAAFAQREALKRGNRPRAIALATITLLVATSASAFTSDAFRARIATAATSAASLATAFGEKLPALDLPQLPSPKSQLAQAQQSLSQRLTQKIRNLFCRYLTIGCDAISLAQSQTQQLATSQVFPEKSATTSRKLDELATNIGGQDHATKSENVKQPASSPQTSPSDVARSASASGQDAGSTASASSPSNAFDTKALPQPVQYITVSGITEALLTSKLLALEQSITSHISIASLASAYQSTRSSDNVGDNIRDLADSYALTFDTGALSADAATLGSLAVTGSGNIQGDLEVAGTLTAGALSVSGVSAGGAVEAPYFTATSTQATSTFAGGISALGPAQFANSANFFATTKFGATGTTTIATDGTISTPEVFAQTATLNSASLTNASLTSATATSLFAQTASAASATAASLTSYNATLGSVVATSSLSLPYLPSALLSTDSSGQVTATTSLASAYLAAIDKAFFFATTSADFWQSERNFFSTTSASYFLAQNQGNAFSTSSASNFLSLNQGLAFSTTSADAWQLTRNFFSTTSTAYFVSVNQGSLFSTTSAIHFAHSSTTIPKTYTANAFTALQTFNAGLALPSLTNSLLATDGSGNVIATSTLASSLLSLPSGYTFRGNTSNLAEATSTLFIASSGNVGVGTSNPSGFSARLAVDGGDLVVNDTTPMLYLRVSGGAGNADLRFGNDLVFTTGAAAERMRITSSGNVGIASTTPYAKLSITNTGSGPSFIVEDSTSPDTTPFIIDASGNIGIGTTTPTEALTVYGSVNSRYQSSNFNTGGVRTFMDIVGASKIARIGTVSGGETLTGTEGEVSFYVKGSEVARFNASGNVGIGTTTPAQKLHVHTNSTASARIRVGNTEGDFDIIGDNADLRFFAAGATPVLDLFDDTTAAFYGSVGIGTTTPSAKLEISDSLSQAVGATFTNTSTGTGALTRLFLRNDGSTGGGQLQVGGTGYTGIASWQDSLVLNSDSVLSGGIKIRAATGGIKLSASGTEANDFYINSSGSVGIGTTSPSAKFEIGDNSTGGIQAFITNSNSATNSYAELTVRNDYNTFNNVGGLRLVTLGTGYASSGIFAQDTAVIETGTGLSGGLNIGTAASAPLGFFTGGTSASNIRMTIDSSGLVGIGTTSPWGALSVAGLSSTDAALGPDFVVDGNQNQLSIFNRLSTARSNQLRFTTAGAANWAIGSPDSDVVGDGSEFFISTNTTGANPALWLETSGNLGIGSTSPWRTLSVTGTAAINGLTSSATGNYVCINTTTWELTRGNGSACTTSSQRFKENIQELDHGLEEILAMRPVSFRYKPEMNMGDATRVGFIAEEMQQLVPEVVALDEQGQPSGIDYPSLTAVLANAIQEIANITGKFKQNLIAFLADAQNGITDLFTKNLYAENITAHRARFEELCLGSVCVTEAQFMAVFGGQTAAQQNQTAAASLPVSGGSSASPTGASDPHDPSATPASTTLESTQIAGSSATSSPSQPPHEDESATQIAQPPPANWTPEQQPANDNSPATSTEPEPANDNTQPPQQEAI